MKLTFLQRKGDGSVVSLLIEPFGTSTFPPKVHSIKVEKFNPADNERMLSRFFVDTEEDAELAAILMLGGTIAGAIPEYLTKILRANKVGEILS